MIFVVLYGIVVGIYGNFSGTVHSRHQVTALIGELIHYYLTDNMIDQALASTSTKYLRKRAAYILAIYKIGYHRQDVIGRNKLPIQLAADSLNHPL